MTTSEELKDGAEEVADEAQEAKEEAKPWIKPLTRAGYTADGFVYIVVGILAMRAALGPLDANVSREEALRRIIVEPLGQVLLIAIAIGLVGYALGHFMMAAREQYKEDKEGISAIVNRAAHVVNGLFHLSLAAAAIQIVVGVGGGGGGDSSEDWTARLLAQPLGRWLVVIVGLGAIGLAIYEFYKAYSASFREVLKLEEMGDTQQKWIVWAGRVGYAARGVVYGVIAYFLFEAAWLYDPEQAGGLGQALAALAAQPYGPWLLGVVAAGLIAFGTYVVFQGIYRRFNM